MAIQARTRAFIVIQHGSVPSVYNRVLQGRSRLFPVSGEPRGASLRDTWGPGLASRRANLSILYGPRRLKISQTGITSERGERDNGRQSAAGRSTGGHNYLIRCYGGAHWGKRRGVPYRSSRDTAADITVGERIRRTA